MSAVPSSADRRARVRVGVGAAVVLVLVALGLAVIVAAMSPHGQSQSIAPAVPTAAAGGEGQSASILVHLLGAVEHPGLYELHDGARAVDAVAAAGGFLDSADQSQINLARFVADGEQIYVPAIGEVPAAVPGGSVGGKVNINTADAAALDTLPRVGPAMAARIIEWRETNGRFSSIEDLMNVTGIGDKTFEGLKDLVTV
ncbi:MAG: ComEA family DNA-binding protein [Rhodoglobus sp.]